MTFLLQKTYLYDVYIWMFTGFGLPGASEKLRADDPLPES